MRRICHTIASALLAFASFGVLSSCHTPPTKVLALYLSHLPQSAFDPKSSQDVLNIFSADIAQALHRNPNEIKLGVVLKDAATGSAFLPFTIAGPDVKVTDSASTPEAYKTYSELWRKALLSKVMPSTADTDRHEAIKLSTGGFKPYNERNEMKRLRQLDEQQLSVSTVGGSKAMQFRLKNTSLDKIGKTLTERTGDLLSGILNVVRSRITILNVSSDPVTVQFTVASDLGGISHEWARAVTDKHLLIEKVFPEFDFEFPATGNVLTSSDGIIKDAAGALMSYDERNELEFFRKHGKSLNVLKTDGRQAMQLRLPDASLDNLKSPWVSFKALEERVSALLAGILNVAQDHVVILSINPGPMIVQFTVYPAAEVNSLNQKWAAAVANKHPSIEKEFPNFDFRTPPVGDVAIPFPDGTMPYATEVRKIFTADGKVFDIWFPKVPVVSPKKDGSPEKPKESSGSVTATYAAGGALLICAGVGGYFYRRRQKKANGKGLSDSSTFQAESEGTAIPTAESWRDEHEKEASVKPPDV